MHCGRSRFIAYGSAALFDASGGCSNRSAKIIGGVSRAFTTFDAINTNLLSPFAMEPLQRDPHLWQQAKARARFQSQLVTYLTVNATLWVIWALTERHHGGIPWPLWATAFWGIGLIGRGVAAYGGYSQEQRAVREYERLKQERGSNDPLDKYR